MARRTEKTSRKRVPASEAKQAALSKNSKGGNWFNLPPNVTTWNPEKKGTYKIDVVPYEVKTDNHPNGIEPGVLWYQFPFGVHHNVGRDSIICPASVGKSCPICKERKRLMDDDYEENKKMIDALRPQKYVAFNIIDPEDEDGIAIFAMSVGKFYNLLEHEISEADEDEIACFFDVTDAGRTLKVRFSDAEFSGQKYIEATKIDFLKRDEMDEDEILEKTVCLDNIFKILTADEINAKLNADEEDGEEGEEEQEEKPAPKAKRTRKKTAKKVEEEEGEEELPKSEQEDDDDWGDDEDEEEEEEEKPAPKKKAPKKKTTKKKPEPEPEEEEEEEEPESDDDSDWGDDDDDDWDD